MTAQESQETKPETAPGQEHVDDSITVVYVHETRVSHSWHLSMMNMTRGNYIAVHYGTDGIADARNKGVKSFLDECDSDWLWWLDTDMGFEHDARERLLEAADPGKRPVVGALCFSWREESGDGMGGYETSPRPTIFDWRELNGETGFLGRAAYPSESLVQCAGTGSACILIHRSVLLKMRENFGDHWYTKIPNPDPNMTDRLIGEDLSFCMRLGALGVPLFVHTGVRTSHHKDVWVSEDHFIDWSLAREALRQMEQAAEVGDDDGLTVDDTIGADA
jgi:hypothetical protein